MILWQPACVVTEEGVRTESKETDNCSCEVTVISRSQIPDDSLQHAEKL